MRLKIHPPLSNDHFIRQTPTCNSASTQHTGHKECPCIDCDIKWVHEKIDPVSLCLHRTDKRQSTSRKQWDILDTYFHQVSNTPNAEERAQLAKETDLTPKYVQVWFQNRRYSLKKRAMHSDQNQVKKRKTSQDSVEQVSHAVTNKRRKKVVSIVDKLDKSDSATVKEPSLPCSESIPISHVPALDCPPSPQPYHTLGHRTTPSSSNNRTTTDSTTPVNPFIPLHHSAMTAAFSAANSSSQAAVAALSAYNAGLSPMALVPAATAMMFAQFMPSLLNYNAAHLMMGYPREGLEMGSAAAVQAMVDLASKAAACPHYFTAQGCQDPSHDHQPLNASDISVAALAQLAMQSKHVNDRNKET